MKFLLGRTKWGIYRLLNPINYRARKPLLDYCREKGIVVQAYGSLFRGQANQLNDALVAQIAAKHRKLGSQVLLRWAHQLGVQVIPRTSRAERLFENANIFDFALDSGGAK